MNLKNNVLSQMAKWIDSGTMFTAFDITKALRNDGHHVGHIDVKRSVRELWDDKYDDEFASYERTTTDFGAVAFVFHPYGKDPEDYDPDWLTATYAASCGHVNPPLAYKTVAAANKTGLTSEGRLNVPLKLIRHIGISDKYWVSNTLNDEILVTKIDPATDDEISDGIDKTKCYTFFREVRISPTILSKLGSKNNYSIEVDKNHIVIT